MALALPQIKEQYLENLRIQFITELKDVIRVGDLALVLVLFVDPDTESRINRNAGRKGCAGGSLQCCAATRESLADVCGS